MDTNPQIVGPREAAGLSPEQVEAEHAAARERLAESLEAFGTATDAHAKAFERPQPSAELKTELELAETARARLEIELNGRPGFVRAELTDQDSSSTNHGLVVVYEPGTDVADWPRMEGDFLVRLKPAEHQDAQA